MKPAPVIPPPRPPRDGNIIMGFHGWYDNPSAGRMCKLLLYARMLAKVIVLALFAVAIGQLGFILFQIMRLGLFS